MANKLIVRICNQEYTLVSENSREYMLETADYVDKKMVAVKNMNGRLSTSMAAILVALNVADEKKQEKLKAEEIIQNQAAEIALLKKQLAELRGRSAGAPTQNGVSSRYPNASSQQTSYPPKKIIE